MSFTHLHLHTQYSLLDGAIRIPDLMHRCAELGMKAIGVTDHGNITGAIEFYKAAKTHGIKPIIGCEFYLSDTQLDDRTKRSAYHFTILARNTEGYQNLIKLVSLANLKGFYYKPRIDRALLKKYSAGLIGMSSCLGGHAAAEYFSNGTGSLRSILQEYKDIFEPGQYYLEVQANGLQEQNELNDALFMLSHQVDIRLVATNDCHYLERKDAYAHDCLVCINTKKLMSDTKRMRHNCDEYYVKSQAEMEDQLGWVPGALESTKMIVDNCALELELDRPKMTTVAGDRRLRTLTYTGLKSLGLHINEEYVIRMEQELSVIERLGFESYMLTMQNIIRLARDSDIPVGPGRGSAAGSLVSYCLGITQVDPVLHGLLFERFLNPHRVSIPDIDIDVCMHRRPEFIRILQRAYGKNGVAHVSTVHQLKSRGAVRDVARALGVPLETADYVAKLVPEPDQGRTVPLKEALEQVPELRRLYETDVVNKQLLDIAMSLEGLHRHVGKHAGGIVIGDSIWTKTPCTKDEDGVLVVQFDKDSTESAGLIKYDILGLKTLTVIQEVLGPVEWGKLKTDDPGVYQLLQSGDTDGVFQLETRGCQEVLTKLKPDSFADIVAILSLYRPGPLQGGMVESFIKRKHGTEHVTYVHPVLEPVLRETYGVLVYQEQAMAAAMAVAGYTAAQADDLRRAIGKKNLEEMNKHKELFVQKGAARVGEDKAVQVLSLIESFANYGFNKSHAVSYAYISYMTAWLKVHKPAQFMAALLTHDRDNLTKYVSSASRAGIDVLPPDINESDVSFTAVDKARVRFGFASIKHVGDKEAQKIVTERSKNGDYVSLSDFILRCTVNKRAIEALIKTGCFMEVERFINKKNRAYINCPRDLEDRS